MTAAQSRQPFQEVQCAQDLDPAAWPPADSAGGPGLPLCPVSSTPDVLCPLASGPLQGLVSLSFPEKPEDRPSWGQVWAPEGRERLQSFRGRGRQPHQLQFSPASAPIPPPVKGQSWLCPVPNWEEDRRLSIQEVPGPRQELQRWQAHLSQCRCGSFGQLCLSFGVTDTLVQDRATKQTTSKACPTVLVEGNKFCPRGSSLLLKTQRQNWRTEAC